MISEKYKEWRHSSLKGVGTPIELSITKTFFGHCFQPVLVFFIKRTRKKKANQKMGGWTLMVSLTLNIRLLTTRWYLVNNLTGEQNLGETTLGMQWRLLFVIQFYFIQYMLVIT